MWLRVTEQLEPEEPAAGPWHCVMCGWVIRSGGGRRRAAFRIPEQERGEPSELAVYCTNCFERELGS